MEYISEIHKEHKIERVYVCGPPPQNNMFIELQKKIMNHCEITQDKIFIL